MSAKRDAADDFARLLEDAALATGDRDATDAAGSHPELALVAALRSTGAALAPATALSEATRAAQRQRLMAVAHVQGVGAGTAAAPAAAAPAESTGLLAGLRRFSASLQTTRRTVAVAGGMASVVAVAGVAVAASSSLPGDPFYDVKRTTEAAQLKLARSDESRGELHLAIAATRLREVDGLTHGRDAFALGPASTGAAGLAAFGGTAAERILSTLEAMDDQTSDGVETLTQVANDEKDPEPLRIISAFASSQGAKLNALLPDLPAAARTQASASLALVNEVKADSEQLLTSSFCTAACDPAQALPTVPPAVPTVVPPGQPSPATPTPCGCVPAPTPTRPAPAQEPTATPVPTPTPSPVAPTVPTVPPVAPVVPTTPPAVPPAPVVPTTPPVTLPPLIPLPLPTEIILPTVPGLPLPTSVPLPDLELPTLPGLPPLLGD